MNKISETTDSGEMEEGVNMMRVMRIFVLAAMAVMIVTLMAQADELVSFSRAMIGPARDNCQARVMAKLDDMAVALLPSGNLGRLQEIDQSAKLIEQNADVEKYWIADKSKDFDAPTIFETEHHRLIKLPFDDAQRVISTGVMLVKCMDMNYPPDKVSFTPEFAPPMTMLADIDSLMALVSADSIRAYIQRLEDFSTRYSCTDSFDASAGWIMQKFQNWGYDNVSLQDFSMGWCNSKNVITTKLGESAPDVVIVVGGHFDSVVYDGDPNIYAPGADDNASGTAMTMEIARVLSATQFKKTIKFALFGAEEQGLIGSEYYVYVALNEGENIELMINADMIGNVADDYLNFSVKVNDGGLPFGNVVRDLAQSHTNLIPEVMVGHYNGSDSYPFDMAGFRVVYSEEGDFSPNWHLQSDIIANVDVDFIANIARSNLGMLALAANAPSPVMGLSAINAGNGNMAYLQWRAAQDADVAGYEIYKGLSADRLTICDTAYTSADTIPGLIDDSTYYFGVSAFTGSGNRSIISEVVSLYIHSMPTRPDTLTIAPLEHQLQLNWTETPDLDFDHYQVWRRVGIDGNFEAFGQTTTPSFLDTDLQSNVRYYYYVTVVDTTGLVSQASVTDYSKAISFDSGILFVDEMRDGSGSQGQPNGAQQDTFFNYITAGYNVTFHDYDVDGRLRVNDLGPYSTVVWDDDDAAVHRINEVDGELGRYIDAGGKMLFTGWRTLYAYGNNRPLSFPSGTFVYNYFRTTSAYSTNSRDFSGATGLDGWPNLMVVPERSLPGAEGRLMGVDVLTILPMDYASPIYAYISESGDSLLQGKTCGIEVERPTSKLIDLTFPLWVLGNDPARDFFVRSMNWLGEPMAGVDEPSDGLLPREFSTSNYPNPFNGATTIRFSLAAKSFVGVEIFDILGRRIRMLAGSEFGAGRHDVIWDGKDETGNEISSGIYFYRIKTGEGIRAKKMLMLK